MEETARFEGAQAWRKLPGLREHKHGGNCQGLPGLREHKHGGNCHDFEGAQAWRKPPGF